jgi:CheY-like chemotaxis protein
VSRPEILVVDDERPLRELLASLFEEAGFRVRAAIHGRDAIAQIELASPDLIIMDLMMPVAVSAVEAWSGDPRNPDHRHERGAAPALRFT